MAKRVVGRVTEVRKTSTAVSVSGGGTATPSAADFDLVIITPTGNFTIANPTGTPVDGQQLGIRIRSDASARTITWGSNYQSSGLATLPTTTVASKTTRYTFEYDSNASKWVLLAADSTGY